MTESIHQILSRSIVAILRPLVRILLRNGIAYGSFAELAKKVYTEVAFEDFAPDRKKQTISRVSALTGLTRKEVKRLHEIQDSDQSESEQRYNRAVRVISGWVNDKEFRKPGGEPDDLPVEGEKGSFTSLVKKYSGDVPTQSMLTVLSAAGSVEKMDDKVRLIRHAYVPGNDPVDKLNILGSDVAELASTIDHNLVSNEDQLRFQRKVSNHRLRADALADFQNMASQKSQALLEELDAWLSEHETDTAESDSDQGFYVSLGIYYYQVQKGREDPS